jgi:hypothetical protein
MTAKQFNTALDKLGYTKSSFARQMRRGLRTVRRWGSTGPDGQPVPVEIAMLLNLMIKTNSTAEDLEA